MYLSGRFCFKHLAVIYSGQHEWGRGEPCQVHRACQDLHCYTFYLMCLFVQLDLKQLIQNNSVAQSVK